MAEDVASPIDVLPAQPQAAPIDMLPAQPQSAPVGVKLGALVDLALGTPDVGAVNFNVLHTVLHAIISRLNITDSVTELSEEDQQSILPNAQKVRPKSVHFMDDSASVITSDSGFDTVSAVGSTALPRRSTVYHAIHDRLGQIENQLETLNALPNDRELIDQLLGDGQPSRKPVADLWQTVQMKRKIDSNEDGLTRLTSLVDELMRQMARLKEENVRLNQQLKDLSDAAKVWEKISTLEKAFEQLSEKLLQMAEKMDAFPNKEFFQNLVTWEALESALRGVREDMAKMKPPDRVVVNMATDPMSRPSSGADGPSARLRELLKDLGLLTERHDVLEGRVEKLEDEMPNKADKSDLENLKVPDDLLQQIADMKSQLDNLLSLRNRDNDAMARIREALTHLQNEMDKLNNLVQNLISENRDALGRIQQLFTITTDHEDRKADISFVIEKVDPKADKVALESKVNVPLFDETTGNLHKLIEDVLNKLLAAEEELRRLLSEFSGDLDGKLDRMELDALKEWIEKRLKALAAKIRANTGPMADDDDDAAGLRKQLLQHFHCISCDRPLDLQINPALATLPEKPGLSPTKTLRPYTTFELDAIRQHARHLTGGDMIDSYFTPRAAGGQHTTTFPNKRVSKMAAMTTIFAEEEVSNPPLSREPTKLLREELDLQGVDGHIYKGRVERMYTDMGPTDKLPPVQQQQQATLRPQTVSSIGGDLTGGMSPRPTSSRTPRVQSARSRPISAKMTTPASALRPTTPAASEGEEQQIQDEEDEEIAVPRVAVGVEEQ